MIGAACQRAPDDQNIIITDNSAGADIEGLPDDEGAAADEPAEPANDANAF